MDYYFEDKAILKEKIQEKYPNITENQLSQIIKLNYSGRGASVAVN